MRLASVAALSAVAVLPALFPVHAHAAAPATDAPAPATDALGERTGEVAFTLSAADLGAGMSWGKGTLTFQGHTYNFGIRGGSGAAIGFSHIHAKGTVFNLYRAQDLEGTYWSVQGEATIGAGTGGAVMENNNGVRIKFTSRSTGARLAFSVERLTIRLRN